MLYTLLSLATLCAIHMDGFASCRELTRCVRAGADLLSGVYHWGVDNYGDGATPVFGSQIAGFQVSPTMHSIKALSMSDAVHTCASQHSSPAQCI